MSWGEPPPPVSSLTAEHLLPWEQQNYRWQIILTFGAILGEVPFNVQKGSPRAAC